jgi:hypothetical protein
MNEFEFDVGVVEKWTNPLMQPVATSTLGPSIPIFNDADCIPVFDDHQVTPKPAAFSIPIFDDSQIVEPVSQPAPLPREPEPTPVVEVFEEFVAPVVAPVVEQPPADPIIEIHEDQTINTKLALEDIEKMFTEEDFFVSDSHPAVSHDIVPWLTLGVVSCCVVLCAYSQ